MRYGKLVSNELCVDEVVQVQPSNTISMGKDIVHELEWCQPRTRCSSGAGNIGMLRLMQGETKTKHVIEKRGNNLPG